MDGLIRRYFTSIHFRRCIGYVPGSFTVWGVPCWGGDFPLACGWFVVVAISSSWCDGYVIVRMDKKERERERGEE